MRHGKREDNTNCGSFDYRAEGVRVIKDREVERSPLQRVSL